MDDLNNKFKDAVEKGLINVEKRDPIPDAFIKAFKEDKED